jgi:REP element-mobilizing transposase RayT
MMSQFWQVYLHLVWGTWKRRHTIKRPLETIAHQVLREVAREMGLVPIIVHSAWNHTHSLISWSPGCEIESTVAALKNASEERVEAFRRENAPSAPALRWQSGHAAFSVNPGSVERVKRYIARQKDLHRAGQTVYAYEGWLGTYED